MKRAIDRHVLGAAILLAAMPSQAWAGVTADAAAAEEDADGGIIVTGTRRSDQQVLASSAPIDVYSAPDLQRQGSGDMQQVLKTLLPSFNVTYHPAADGSAFVRSPTLRGLPGDEILVLINGKRFHRSALVQLGGGTLADGAQGVDLSQISTAAIDRVEVLRDGAAAQYGSDAIAGVINYQLRNERSGLSASVRYGQFYEGDGDDYQASLNFGLPLGNDGFLNVTYEHQQAGETSRGAQRPGALALVAAYPNLAGQVRDPVQLWGNPDAKTDRLFVNSAVPLGNGAELYFFGNFNHSRQENSFNYRQPISVSGPGAGGVGTANFAADRSFSTIYTSLNPDGSANAAGNTFSILSIYPAGFTPRFGARITDMSAVLGYRGGDTQGLNYDLSASFGQNRIDYRIDNTINASLGPTSPTSFRPGSLRQREFDLNLDLTHPLDLGGATPFTLAGGLEFRREAYKIGMGDPASYAVGPYARVPLSNANGTPVLDASGNRVVMLQSVGSNGFPGYGPDSAMNAGRSSYAGHLDLEGDITSAFTVGLAGRYEHFEDFGDTANGKLSLRYAFGKVAALRGTASTGFRAPTPGQLYTQNISTAFLSTSPQQLETGTYPATSAAARFYGAVPLKPEKALNLAAGLVLTPANGLAITADYYNIRVKNRIGMSASFTVSAADREKLRLLGVTNYASLGSVRFFTNAFDTRTQGVDLTATYDLETASVGRFLLRGALNYNRTKVIKRRSAIINDVRVGDIENLDPHWKGNVGVTWMKGRSSLLVRVSYYGKATDYDAIGNLTLPARAIVDIEESFRLTERLTVSVGASNLFDSYPAPETRGGVFPQTGGRSNGQIYPTWSPVDYNGGFWYLRAAFKI